MPESEGELAAVARADGIAKVYTDFETVLNDDRVDAVGIRAFG